MARRSFDDGYWLGLLKLFNLPPFLTADS